MVRLGASRYPASTQPVTAPSLAHVHSAVFLGGSRSTIQVTMPGQVRASSHWEHSSLGEAVRPVPFDRTPSFPRHHFITSFLVGSAWGKAWVLQATG